MKPLWKKHLGTMPKLSLRYRFAVGLGAMLLPFFMLAGSNFIVFERAISSFESSENATLEKRFPLAELSTSFQAAGSVIEDLIQNPDNQESFESLENLNRSITRQLNKLQNLQNPTPEEVSLLTGIKDSWNRVYATTQDYTQSPAQSASQNDKESIVLDQINTELDLATNGIARIEILIAHIQTSDNLAMARKLKRQERRFIGLASWIAITIALLSAFLLSRSVLRSMQILIQGIEHLSQGNLDKRIEWTNKDEFGRLANAINQMAERLAQSQQALIEIATLDGLTGLYNRREFNRLLHIEIERARRDSRPVSMVMVDIDYFKAINDTYGHQRGDDALKFVAQVLKEEIRPGDIAARYGGEEFALILPRTQTEEAGIVAERIRVRMEQEELLFSNNERLSLTASLGCATFPYVGDSEDKLLYAADKALYSAKENGRNRVVYHAQLTQSIRS